jgi:hypothetical protein
MKRHSRAPLLGRSYVGSTQQAAIQFAMVNVASSAFADIQATTSARRLQVAFLPFAHR